MNRSLLLAALTGLVALILAALGASSLAVIPDFNLRLVEGVVCPRGQTLEYQSLGQFTYTDADGTHNRERVSISCVAADGTRQAGKGTATISALAGLYFLICWAPLLAGALLLRRSLLRRNN